MEFKKIINDKQLLKLLKEKGDVVKKAREVHKNIEKLEKERAKLGQKIQDYRDKMIPLIRDNVTDIGEFQDVVQVDISKDGKEVVATVVDLIEQFKVAVKENRKKLLEAEHDRLKSKKK